MIAPDTWAAVAATVSGSAIAVRARMLQPHQLVWTKAPRCVWISLSALALVVMTRAVGLWFGAHATPGEALVYTALAVSSVAMLWNLNRNGRDAAMKEAQIRREVDVAWEQATGHALHPPIVPAYHLNAPKGSPGRGEGQ